MISLSVLYMIKKIVSYKTFVYKVYLHANDPYQAKYQFLINKRESTGLKHFTDPKAFI